MDFCVFTTTAITSFASGALVTSGGWTWMNFGTIAPVVGIALALVWLHVQRRAAPLAGA